MAGKLRQSPEGIAQALRVRMQSGQMIDGDRLPSEHALAKEFSVSRAKVREALVWMKAWGLISTRRGAKGGAFFVASGSANTERLFDDPEWSSLESTLTELPIDPVAILCLLRSFVDHLIQREDDRLLENRLVSTLNRLEHAYTLGNLEMFRRGIGDLFAITTRRNQVNRQKIRETQMNQVCDS